MKIPFKPVLRSEALSLPSLSHVLNQHIEHLVKLEIPPLAKELFEYTISCIPLIKKSFIVLIDPLIGSIKKGIES